MACFLFFTAFILVFMISPALCFFISLKLDTPAVVVVLPDHPLSPFKGVPNPDVSPLLPSPFGSSSSSSSIIPSNPSPPNPDEVDILAPGSSLSPAGAPLSSSSSLMCCSVGIVEMVSLLVVATLLMVLVV